MARRLSWGGVYHRICSVKAIDGPLMGDAWPLKILFWTGLRAMAAPHHCIASMAEVASPFRAGC
jgi:hypothetical protein